MLSFTRFLRPAVIAAMLVAAPAHAATLGVFTHDYGRGPGKVDPAGNDYLGTNYVKVSDASTSRFADGFDFSALSGHAIDGLELTLSFAGAGPSFSPKELWAVRLQGFAPALSTDDQFGFLVDPWSPQTFRADAASDAFFSSSAFARSLAAGRLDFWFSEFTHGLDKFKLASARLTVTGLPAAVPLPAGGLLLLGALGGVVALRRRRKAA